MNVFPSDIYFSTLKTLLPECTLHTCSIRYWGYLSDFLTNQQIISFNFLKYRYKRRAQIKIAISPRQQNNTKNKHNSLVEKFIARKLFNTIIRTLIKDKVKTIILNNHILYMCISQKLNYSYGSIHPHNNRYIMSNNR